MNATNGENIEVRTRFWNAKHAKYGQSEWIRKPTIFAREVIDRFPPGANVLDLGSGQGQDSLFFQEKGYEVVALDFSSTALAALTATIEERNLKGITVVNHDLSRPLPFEHSTFDVVFSHLNLHYFDDVTTRFIFAEVARILRPDGLLCVLVNSVEDPEYTELVLKVGRQIEENYFEVETGDFKRYFTRKYMFEITRDLFIPYILDDRGRTHKDKTDRFIKLVANLM